MSAPTESATQRVASRRRTIVRICLALLTSVAAVLGIWAGLFPRSFYDSFPGFGRQWVAIDGPFNEHLVRDFGNLNAVLAVMTAIATVTLARVLVPAVAIGWLVYSVPHLTYHLHHFAGMDTADVVGNVVALGGSVALPIVVLVLWGGARSDGPSEPLPS